uniref:Tripartite motif containing 59 n=1 Tax=Sinocyclocheilus grahami TaxID=75366 RepID=A0A672NY83_SINGR
MDDLEEDLTCSVCYALFSDPRVLPCSHTFCRSCLKNVLQVSVSFSIWRPLRLPLKCPSCRSVVELPTNGVDALPVNVCLRAIVEKYQRERPPACPEHPRQPLNVYCVQDRKLICGFCLTVGQHQGHAIDDLQTACVKERGAQSRLTESLRWEEVCGLAERLAQEKERSHALVQNDREVVSRFFQGLDLILAQKEERFLQALDRASVLLASAYDPLIQQVKDMQEQHSELLIARECSVNILKYTKHPEALRCSHGQIQNICFISQQQFLCEWITKHWSNPRQDPCLDPFNISCSENQCTSVQKNTFVLNRGL